MSGSDTLIPHSGHVHRGIDTSGVPRKHPVVDSLRRRVSISSERLLEMNRVSLRTLKSDRTSSTRSDRSTAKVRLRPYSCLDFSSKGTDMATNLRSREGRTDGVVAFVCTKGKLPSCSTWDGRLPGSDQHPGHVHFRVIRGSQLVQVNFEKSAGSSRYIRSSTMFK
jgi:hypothetical protein